MTTQTALSLRRLQLAGAVAFALAVAGGLAWEALRSPNVPFLRSDGTPWIVAQTPIQTHGMKIELAHPPVSFFERRFRVDELPLRAMLQVRALRDVSLHLNRTPVPLVGLDSSSWKEGVTVDVTALLVPGDNVIFARVANPDGNPALQLRLDGLEPPIETDERWLAAWEGDPVGWAARADDVLRHPGVGALPSPLPSLAALAVPLVLLFGLGCGIFSIVHGRPAVARWAPAAALVVASFVWAALFARVVGLPAGVGFDAEAHLAYFRWILEHRALPVATDGAAMYHPPLFHAFGALLLAVGGAEGPVGRALLVAPGLLSGFGMALVAGRMARTLVPGAPWLEAGSVLAAGLLPMSLTLAACASNEAPHAFLASFALLEAFRALVRERASLRDDLVVGVWLAAAVLTKYSSLALVPILVGALATKRLFAERSGAARAAAGGALTVGVVAVLAGWFYVRHFIVSGHPLVWNLNATPGETWWQLPGFHTSAYFLGFGDALTHPWFSSFHSLWDGLYTTLWGDGLLSGAAEPALAGDRWRYDWMAAGYALALPATGFLVLGWLQAARRALRGEDLGRRLGWSLVVLLPIVFLTSVVSALLRYPFWSGTKAFYALLLTPSLALLGVLGFEALDGFLARRAPRLRALPFGWAAAFGGAIAWAYLG